MRTLKALIVAIFALAALAPHTRAQSLPISLFERYLDSLRQQAGIPGLSAAIVESGRTVWDAGLGYREVEGFVGATADTPYPLLGLTEPIASTVLLDQCVEQRGLEISDAVQRWNSRFPDSTSTLADVLRHRAPGGGFKYDPARYAAALTDAITECAHERYTRVVGYDVLNRLGMSQSVPGHSLGAARAYFTEGMVSNYNDVLRRVAVSYRVDASLRPSRSSYVPSELDASTGLVSTVRDLAKFDSSLNVLLSSSSLDAAWTPASGMPTGLGWFVQSYNGQRIVWQFGLARDAYSALYIKVPGRNVTLILLANSDGLAAPYNLSDGNLTSSLFAQLFLKLFVS